MRSMRPVALATLRLFLHISVGFRMSSLQLWKVKTHLKLIAEAIHMMGLLPTHE